MSFEFAHFKVLSLIFFFLFFFFSFYFLYYEIFLSVKNSLNRWVYEPETIKPMISHHVKVSPFVFNASGLRSFGERAAKRGNTFDFNYFKVV